MQQLHQTQMPLQIVPYFRRMMDPWNLQTCPDGEKHFSWKRVKACLQGKQPCGYLLTCEKQPTFIYGASGNRTLTFIRNLFRRKKKGEAAALQDGTPMPTPTTTASTDMVPMTTPTPLPCMFISISTFILIKVCRPAGDAASPEKLLGDCLGCHHVVIYGDLPGYCFCLCRDCFFHDHDSIHDYLVLGVAHQFDYRCAGKITHYIVKMHVDM